MAPKSFTAWLFPFCCASCPCCTSAMPPSAASGKNAAVAGSATIGGVVVLLFESDIELLLFESIVVRLLESVVVSLSFPALLQDQEKKHIADKNAITFFMINFLLRNMIKRLPLISRKFHAS